MTCLSRAPLLRPPPPPLPLLRSWSLGMMVWEMVEGLLPKWAIMSWFFTSTLHFPDTFSQVRG